MTGLAAGTAARFGLAQGARRTAANLRDARRQLHRVFVYCRREDGRATRDLPSGANRW
jgi:hypothetical protein